MKGSKREALLLAVLLALAGVFLIISCRKVMAAGPLDLVLKEPATRNMLLEVVCVFIWNLFCLTRPARKSLRLLGVGAGILLFTWCHRILLPLLGAFLYMALLILWGRWLRRLISLTIKENTVEEISLSLVTGSGFWMVFVCLVSLTGHGGIGLWRLCALGLGAAAVLGEAIRIAGRYKKGGLGEKGSKRPGLNLDWLPEGCFQAWLLAFIITMVLIQAGRMNIELDYDSLHYGLRSAYVLDNGRGIYENLGMVNLVYTYSKGLEVLVLPLCSTFTYGFVLSFSLWMAVAVLALGGTMVSRIKGRGMGLFAAAILSSIPGIMNMADTAKSDIITLVFQLVIYHFLCRAFEEGEAAGPGAKAAAHPGTKAAALAGAGGRAGTPWLLMAGATYLLTLVFKPTALVFSTALMGAALLCLILKRRFSFGCKKGWLLLLIPAGAAAGLWYRTWLMTGVPVTSIFAGMFEKMGFKVKYPFSFHHVIGDASLLTAGEKLTRLKARLGEMLIAPISQDMAHVMIAWGSCLVTLFLLIWVWSAYKGRKRKQPVDLFDRVLLPVMALGCMASIYTLSQVDGNYFILFYALLVISSLRMSGGIGAGKCAPGGKGFALCGSSGVRAVSIAVLCFMVYNVPVTCTTSWAGNPGFTPVCLKHKGYYNHQKEAGLKRKNQGSLSLTDVFTPRTRVLAFGNHPQVLDLPCSVQSYYDVTGSGGNVYLVKRLAYFEQFLEYADTEYFFAEAGYLGEQPRALEMIEDMIEEGTLTDIRYEKGNMRAKVTLPGTPPKNPEQAVEEFHCNYKMSAKA